MRTFIQKSFIVAGVMLLTVTANAQVYQPAPKFGTQGCIDFDITSLAPDGGNSKAKAHALLPNGKIIIAGYHYSSSNNSFATNLLKLDPVCGILDTTFGENGKLVHTFWGRTMLHDIALQTDGKIVGCGMIAPNNAGSQQWAGIFRFHADGTVDSSLDGTGYITTPLPGPGTFHNVMLDNTDRITVVGKSGSFGQSNMIAVRYLTDGTLDNTYGVNGMAKTAFDYFPSSGQMAGAMHADGSITIAAQVGVFGGPTYYLGLCKFTPGGAPDANFNLNGKISYPSIAVSNNSSFKEMDMAVLSDNRVVIAYGDGSNGSTDQTANVVAIKPDGTIDSAFGTNGVFKYAIVGADAGGLHVSSDNKILLFFRNHWNDGPAGMLRLMPDGTLDASFGNNGVILTGAPNDQRGFNDGFILPNGDIVAYGGKSGIGMSTMRFTTDTLTDAIPFITNNNGTLSIDSVASAHVQWYFNGSPIAGATNFSYFAAIDGAYKVVLEYNAGCAFESQTIDVTTVSITEVNQLKSFKIYPNPSEGIFIIESKQNTENPINYVVYDFLGKTVANGILNPQSGKFKETINLKDKARGMYFLKLNSVVGSECIQFCIQ